MIQAIFFDFNGVIVNDEPLHLKAYQQTLAGEGIELTEETYMTMLGMDDLTFVRANFERAGKSLTDEMAKTIMAREWELHRQALEEELPLAPGVVTFVKAASRHFELGVVSMATRAGIEYGLKRARIEEAFTVIVSASDVQACKPDPCCYERGLERLNEKRREARRLPLLPQECLVIEDSPPGIRSGLSAGMKTIGVTNTVSEEALRAAQADVVTHSLADWTIDAVHHVFD